MEKYIKPDFEKEAFTCPHCGTNSLMNYVKVNFKNENYCNTTDKFSHYGNLSILIASCVTCKKKIIWIDNQYVYPDIVAEEPNNDMPDSVKELYNEAGLIYNKSPRAACALLRLAIDRLCNELGKTDRDINKNIAALVKDGLPTTVQQALDVVRVIGNKAVHPGQIDFDVDEESTASMLMHLLNIIVNRMITEPKEINAMYQNLPDSVKESITKRDK